MARWHSCIVVDSTSKGERRLWQFAATGKFNLLREEVTPRSDPLPEKVVAKDWPTLLQPKLNIAWLPPTHVFLRVIQLPKSDLGETQSMIDLQLEKLSPLPVAQIVWTFELLPQQQEGEMQTAIVVIAPRHQVEQFLGDLEGHGYLADRLEVPLIDQIRCTQITGDGVWIFPDHAESQTNCLVAWHYGGTLCNLSLLTLPADGARTQILQEHITQISWAGEIEGWLNGPLGFHLVATPEIAEGWREAFPQDHPLELVTPLPAQQLAAHTVRRATQESGRLNLLPPDYAARYRQQLIDRLWMRALGGLVVLYVVGVAVYMLWAQFARWQHTRVESQVSALGATYTNTMRLKEEVRILRDQFDLQYAALDCWKAVAENLPSELTLTSLSFSRGKTLTIRGKCSSGHQEQLFQFNEKLREATVNNRRLLKEVAPPKFDDRAGTVNWNFTAELNRTVAE